MIHFVIAFFSIVVLAALHEFGHFIVAKKCGVKVEEFGIGYPPRIWGKQFGETFYSLNWLPFGAFVKMEGEEGEVDSPTSFSNQSIANKIWITLGGVISFWLISVVIYSFLSLAGSRMIVQNDNFANLSDFQVGIFEVAKNSPAEEVGLQPGDMVEKIIYEGDEISPTTIKEMQDFVGNHLGKELTLIVERGETEIEKRVLAREDYPDDQGPIGVALLRTAIEKYPWYLAPVQGVKETWNSTVAVVRTYSVIFGNLFRGEFKEENLVSSVGIFQIIAKSQEFGFYYFLSLMAFLSINLAVFNSLPIPLVDGGRAFFLIIEVIRNEPIPQKIEEKINLVSFIFLGGLVIWVTVRDIINLF